MAKKNIFESIDWKTFGKYAAIVGAGALAILNEASNQKEKAEIEEMKKAYEILTKGKKS